MLKSKNDSSWNRDQYDVETEKDFCWNPEDFFSISKTHFQKPFANQTDFDLDFENLGINRFWVTFEIENMEIENLKTVFFLWVDLCNSLYNI